MSKPDQYYIDTAKAQHDADWYGVSDVVRRVKGGAWVTVFAYVPDGAENPFPCSHENQHVNDASLFVCDDCGELLGR